MATFLGQLPKWDSYQPLLKSDSSGWYKYPVAIDMINVVLEDRAATKWSPSNRKFRWLGMRQSSGQWVMRNNP